MQCTRFLLRKLRGHVNALIPFDYKGFAAYRARWHMSFLPLVKLWLCLSAFATTAGWVLSAVGLLNTWAYVVFFGAGLAVLAAVFKLRTGTLSDLHFGRLRAMIRWRRPLPAFFLFLAALVFLGGVLYAPSNHTALSYRTPRVLQWLAEGHWFWIHTPNYRMNDRACGYEWLSAPLLLLTKSDRALFLLNFVPFLLLPGLLFSLYTRLGVAARVAWQWMWLVPTGYTFLLQAGSAGNDTFPTVYALAAVDFACRAWATRRFSDLAYSLLAAALLTGAKASNLPLLLPWAVILVPLFIGGRNVVSKGESSAGPIGTTALIRLRIRPGWLLLLVLLSGLVSFIPTAILNVRYCGDWSGLALERTGMAMKNPLVGVWGNAVFFVLDNFVPPFLPGANWWNQHGLELLPGMMVRPLVSNFEASFHWLWELPTEDWAGLGFGVSWLAFIALVAALKGPLRFNPPTQRADVLPAMIRRLALVAPWLALLAFCAKSGMSTGARLISPYYPLLLPLILVLPGQTTMVRRKWWKALVWINLILAVPVLVLCPGRPLWPARSILGRLHSAYPNRGMITRANNVYSIYSTRSDPLATVRSLLPHDLKKVGFMARGDDSDISLWRPFGDRRVLHVLPTDRAEILVGRGIDWIVAGEYNFELNGTTFDEWAQRTGVQLVAIAKTSMRVSEPAQAWYIVRVRR